MGTSIAKDQLIAAMSVRYDYYSARAMLERALRDAGLPDQASYSTAEVAALKQAVEQIGDRIETVLTRLEELSGGAAPAPRKEAPKPAAAPTPEPEAKAAEPEARTEADKKAGGPEPDDKTEPNEKAEPDAKAKADTKPEPDKKADKKADSAAGKDGAAPTLTIKLIAPKVPGGAEVLACGGSPKLGDWKPEKAAALKKAKDGSYRGEVELTGADEIELKFLYRDADGGLHWEGGDNRKVKPGTIDAEWHAD